MALDRNKAEKPPGPRIAGVQDSGEAPGERRWLMAGVARRLMAEDRLAADLSTDRGGYGRLGET